VEPHYHCDTLHADGRANSGCAPVGECGDGQVDIRAERCDDGNRTEGDGCAADCSMVEPGYLCPTPGHVCERVVDRRPRCGDGVLQAEDGEACDDGINDGRLGGCSADCQIPYCGDGQVQPDFGEECDSGVNDGAYGGCTPDCRINPLAPSHDCTVLGSYCGDGILQPEFEACDFAISSSFECDSSCRFARPGSCGDGVLDEGYEECDDSNRQSCDGCSAFCSMEWPIP
jgi:cysteine-rich repeat protein